MDREAIQERFGIVGRSKAIHHVIDRVRLVARADISVLVQGESGVGKELIAGAVHALSPRRHEKLVVVNCGAIPEGLIESELFGAEKGAYTGAVERRSGYFEEADGGTIFLDEIGEMPLQAQVRLLRVLETGEFSRVGSSTIRKTDARVIAATNKNLADEVARGRFREDLYYRLSTVIIDVPPLRERREDILPILETFLHRFAQKYNAAPKRLADDARAFLERYHWPGNVRELRNLAEQLVVLVPQDPATAEHVRAHLRGVTSDGRPGELVPVARPEAGEAGSAGERELIYRILLELRMEMRELKEQLRDLASQNVGVVVSRGGESDRTPEPGEYVIVRDAEGSHLPVLFEDVAYEIAADANGQPASDAADDEDEDAPMPTLEEAERRLIAEALDRFDGNRRQTARALGISERTLYRKLKEIEA